jgi:hypothetical protein
MTHPKREDWMSYLYDELAASERSTLKAHLDSCAECRAQVSAWQSAGTEMNAWKLPRRAPRQRPSAFLRWAAAAVIVGLAMVGALRLNTLSHEVTALRAELERTPRRGVVSPDNASAKAAGAETQALMAALAQEWEQKRLRDQQALLGALQKMNARHAQDYAALRKELETVAVFSEAGWQTAQNQISSLAMTPNNISDAK